VDHLSGRGREVDRAYALGRQAGRSCLAAVLNPFELGTDEALEWMRGWTREVAEELRARKQVAEARARA
jgi:NOL1/NOP2/fmu family ribosome biogenesis protein